MTNRPGLLDVGDINAGHDTTRLSAAEQDRAHRQQQRDAASRYLYARFPADVAAELAEILGLDDVPPAREPGMCRCGSELAVSTTNSSRSLRALGICAACARGGVA